MSAKPTENRWRNKGLAAVELACGSVFLLVLTLFFIDITVLMLGYELNDKACRDACRAAAQQGTPMDAQNAAAAILRTHRADGNFVTDPILLTGPTYFQYQDYVGDPTAGNPMVTVTTECRVKTPVPLGFVGSLFGHDSSWQNNSWTFRKQYSFPIAAFNLVLP